MTPEPTACPSCLRRARLLARLAPYIERVATGSPGSRSPELLRLSNEDLVAAVAPRAESELLETAEALSERSMAASLSAAGCWGCCRHDPAYPEGLRDAADAPWALIGRGDPALLGELADRVGVLTVVGARRASSYGRDVARQLGRDLAAAGLVVVSGLAFGIDACAHRGALETGRTVAVLGCGADVAYPAAHRSLWRRVQENGLVLSELPPGTGAWRWSFPARNRIMAAMAGMTVVVEAAEKSGSLGTAEVAADLGREVGAVPGAVNSRVSAGTNSLLSDGAYVVRSSQDVLDAMVGMGARRASTAGASSGVEDGFREMSCPNCGQKHRGISACALGVVLGVIEDRGELALDTITPEIVAEIDVNQFWDGIGPLTDRVEEQLLALGAQEVADQ